MPYTGEETNKKLGALVVVTEKLVESREEEKKDASFFDVPSPVGATSKIPNIPSIALPRMGDAGRAGQAEDDAEGTTEPDEEKRNSLLSKMTGFLADQAKEKGKVAKLGLKGFFGTLIFGGFLIALGKFLQSDTFKKATEFIDKTLIPKLKEFYDAFFGPEGGLFKGIMTLFGDDSGIGAIVAGIAGVLALFAVGKVAALFSPLTLGLGLLFRGIKGLAGLIPRVPGAPPPPPPPTKTPPKPGAPQAGGGMTDAQRRSGGGRPRPRPKGRFGKLLNIGKFLADKAKKLLKSPGAKTVPKVPGVPTAPTPPKPPAVTTPPKPPAVVKPPTPPAAAPSKIPTAGAPKAPVGAKPINPLQKFPKVGKFLGIAKRIPGLSAIFAISDLISIFGNDDLSTKAKIAAGVGVFGGLGASVLGGALGMMLGGPIGAALGGLVGYFGGEMLATGLMQWMLGETVDAFPDSWFLPDINGWMNGSGGAKTTGAGGGGAKTGGAGGDAEGKKFNTEPARKQLTAAKAKKDETSMYLEFMRSEQVVTGRDADGTERRGFTGPDAAEKQAQFDEALKADRQAGIEESKAKSQFSYVVSKGKIKNISGLTGDKFDTRELGAKLRFLVGEGVMDDKYAAEQFNGGKTSFAFVAEVNKTYDDLLTQKSKVRPAPAAAGPAASGALAGMSEAELAAGYAAEGRSMQKPARGSMRLGLNKVGPQTADLTAAIARKVAMSGDTSTAAAATQQGGGNTQINNVTKKDGDVTHMPKSDIRNNKFAALNRSAYAAGAI